VGVVIIIGVLLVAFLVTDGVSGGVLRDELIGGVSGAGRNVWETETKRARAARKARRKKNSGTRWGQFKNAIGEELITIAAAAGKGYAAGRRARHDKRKARKAERRQERAKEAEARKAALDSATTDPNAGPAQAPNGGPNPAPNAPAPDPNAKPAPGAPSGPASQAAPPSGPNTGPPPQPNPAPSGLPLAPLTNEGSTATQGSTETVTDISTAPAAIAAWEALHKKLEAISDDAQGVAQEAATLADSMGDFAVGAEEDTAAAVREFATQGIKALEAVEAEIEALKAEFSASIEAADGKAAAVHAPMRAA
jgi:hypothetical protein